MQHSKYSRHCRRRPWGRFEQLETRRLLSADFRSIDGSGNNLENSDWGAAQTQLLRLTTVNYEDLVSEPAGGAAAAGRPNPRTISNIVAAQSESIENDRDLTSFVFQWGQFIDHDLDLTEEALPVENFSVPVPADDPEMFPGGFVPLLRSRFDPATGTDAQNPRQQINQITSFIDASNVYGSDPQRASALRLGVGGLLRTSEYDNLEFLPYNTVGLHNAAPPPLSAADYFLAGDVRANEQPGLTSLHTLFVREHNRLAREIAAAEFADRDLAEASVDEEIYQRARQIVGALVQSITYNEFLPALLGPDGLSSYAGYDSSVNPAVANIFSAALYRVGHTMLPNELLRLADDGSPTQAGAIGLAESFFQPSLIVDSGIEAFLKGLSVQPAQEIDALVSDSVRNMLFDPPAQFDLAAINIQRGRDHGLPDYNQARIDLGLQSLTSFSQITGDRSTARNLARAYDGQINNLDVWIAAIAEDHLPGGSVGELIHTVLVDQFQRARDGDRFYFENILEGDLLREVQATRLSDVIRRNTTLQDLQDEVFRSDQVLVVRAEVDQAADWEVRVSGRQLEIVDTISGQVIVSRATSEIDRLVVFGSSTADTITVDHSIERLHAPLEIHGGGGIDRLQITGSSRGDYVAIAAAEVRCNDSRIYFGGFESITVEAGNGRDTINGRDATVPLILRGGNGNDLLFGGQYPDLIDGGRGRDRIDGGAGPDILIGGGGKDLIISGKWDAWHRRRGHDFVFRDEIFSSQRGQDFGWQADLERCFDKLAERPGRGPAAQIRGHHRS